MTPLDFLLCGYAKHQVYSTRIIDLDDLKARIRAAIATVDIEMIRSVWTELEFRLDVVHPTRGAHVKWINKKKKTSKVCELNETWHACLYQLQTELQHVKIVKYLLGHGV